MNLETDHQLANTEKKLALLEQQIARASARPATPANLESVRSLNQMANQLREEIVRYTARRQRRQSSLA
jgi:uncharacterized small protein (DUF1192 family)